MRYIERNRIRIESKLEIELLIHEDIVVNSM
jgi:hypothetical protein